ncbi:aerobic-type carbon monoxide dehydrogenase small subunit (CoxS/CutS family) [Aequitasia blattaphilus]|uniref:(2Fe-2S)-binding protein n=1 Tax=Aequitasia blattaphilus TaxID=2949332 RepID=A0ABT1E996_9FIRM|nr:xanthine dehydrogenase subunit XdhC [Aequitasia blattaphilus]MCP1102410.1 (2Fe-2S)-binding protein [Aequitasia blattaphilus]MCR8615050.1 (2Fe-2S)-binding protein [Aequitasia blattaphilus]
MLKVINIKVNGIDREVAVQEQESLLETLRNRLGLTSVKKGCEVGECGACTVLLNGKAIDSCIYLSLWADGQSVVTVEGLKSENGELNYIQKAFIKEAAVQCGFCTPGLILTAVEIIGDDRIYSREELRKLISGHLCRCTGYENILNAIEKAKGSKING